MTDELAVVGLWGPAARQVLEATTRDDVSNAAFPYMSARAIAIGQRRRMGAACDLRRRARLGALRAAGRRRRRVGRAPRGRAGPLGLVPVGYKALESLRLEKGYRYWSADITPSDNPYEAGLGFCVRLGKGDFIGRDALVRAQGRGRDATPRDGDRSTPRRRSTAARPSGATAALLGRLRSGGYGYTVGRNIGFVYLPVELAQARGHAPRGRGLRGARVRRGRSRRAVRPAGRAHPRLSGARAVSSGSRGRRPARPGHARAAPGRRRTSGRPRGWRPAGSRR